MKSEKINIAHLIRTFLQPSETFVYNQIKFVNEENEYKVFVLCKNFKDDLNIENISILKVNELLSTRQQKIDDLYYKFFRKLSNNAKKAILNYIKLNNIKLLHLHCIVDARYYLDVIKEAQIPIVVSGYGWDITNLPSKYYGVGKLYLKKLFNFVDIFLAMSEDMKKDMLKLGIPENKIIIHYHGINTQRFFSPDREYPQKEKMTLLFCGRLTDKKGPLVLLRAVNKIIKGNKEVNLNLKIIGDGPLRSKIQEFISENNLSSYVEILGHIQHFSTHLLNEYKNADIFILPSMVVKNNGKRQNDKEGIPGTLVEAMSSGLPTISTFHAGIPEVIKNGENGLLINENDFIELAEKILLLINDNNLRKKLGKNASNYSRLLDVKIKTKDLVKIYKNLLS